MPERQTPTDSLASPKRPSHQALPCKSNRAAIDRQSDMIDSGKITEHSRQTRNSDGRVGSWRGEMTLNKASNSQAEPY
jgi:hypothetical protein